MHDPILRILDGPIEQVADPISCVSLQFRAEAVLET